MPPTTRPKRDPGRVLVTCSCGGAIQAILALLFAIGIVWWAVAVDRTTLSHPALVYVGAGIAAGLLLLSIHYFKRARWRLAARQNCLDIFTNHPRRIWYADVIDCDQSISQGDSPGVAAVKGQLGLWFLVRSPKGKLILTLDDGEEVICKSPPWIPHERFSSLIQAVDRRHARLQQDAAPAEEPAD